MLLIDLATNSALSRVSSVHYHEISGPITITPRPASVPVLESAQASRLNVRDDASTADSPHSAAQTISIMLSSGPPTLPSMYQKTAPRFVLNLCDQISQADPAEVERQVKEIDPLYAMLRSAAFDTRPFSDLVEMHRLLARKLQEAEAPLEGALSPECIASLYERFDEAMEKQERTGEDLEDVGRSIEETKKRLKLLEEKEAKAIELNDQATKAVEKATQDPEEAMDKPAPTIEELRVIFGFVEVLC